MAGSQSNSSVAPVGQAPRPARRGVSGLVVALLVVASLAIGLVVGFVAYPHIPLPGSSAALPGKATVSEAELDLPMGSYTYEGKKTTVSVRDAILESTTVEAARNSDGTYDIPSADAVLSIARNQVLAADAEERGITATEEDAAAYAEETLGTRDFSQIASSYSMDATQVAELMRRSAVLKKLRDSVITTQAYVEPRAPEAPAAGDEDTPTAEYASYIISLLGDEWDSNANTWARADGPFRTQLKDYTISNDSATYSAAQAAYYVAYTQYSSTQQQVSTEWTDYVNGLLSNVTVELATLVA